MDRGMGLGAVRRPLPTLSMRKRDGRKSQRERRRKRRKRREREREANRFWTAFQDLLPTDMRLGRPPLPVLRFKETAQRSPVAGCP